MQRVFRGQQKNFCQRIEHVKLSKKVLYHFAKFAIVNELLIIENRRISARDRLQSNACPSVPLRGT